MFKIVSKRPLNESGLEIEFVIEAPLVAKKARPGQFIIFRLDEYGERVPVTISATDPEKGTITIMVKRAGKSTRMLHLMEVGDCLADVVGPLGHPTPMEGLKRVCIVVGGVGTAIAYPVAKGMRDRGIAVDMVAGFRSKKYVILEDELRACSVNFYPTTDDGTYGEKGFNVDKLRKLLDGGETYDEVICFGPLRMMKMVCDATRPYKIKTIASLAPIMLDGTGMCGACRLTVGGETKFACVDGPEFDGHQVDWDGVIARSTYYEAEEKEAATHVCRITGGVREHG